MKCAAHPEIETNLTCAKCGRAICLRCLVQTPVGARCPDCARLKKLPTYTVSNRHYLKAAGVGIGMAIACGVVWALIVGLVSSVYVNLLLAAGVGYAIGEVISLSVNRKRGKGLAVIAGVSVVLSSALSLLFPWGYPFSISVILYWVINLVALALGVFIAVSRFR